MPPCTKGRVTLPLAYVSPSWGPGSAPGCRDVPECPHACGSPLGLGGCEGWGDKGAHVGLYQTHVLWDWWPWGVAGDSAGGGQREEMDGDMDGDRSAGGNGELSMYGVGVAAGPCGAAGRDPHVPTVCHLAGVWQGVCIGPSDTA